MVTFNFKLSATKKKSRINTPSANGYNVKDLKRICVYEHYYDDEKLPFYVGQGYVSRAFSFNHKIRNRSWNNKVKDINLIKVKIVNIDITVEESINIEKELIKKYGRLDNNTGVLTNENDGGKNCQIGKDNYFYDIHFCGENNPNYGNKYNLNNNSIPVLQIDIFGNIVKEWASAREAEEIGGYYCGCISACCKGKRHLHKFYQWIYKSDYDKNNNYEYVPGKTNEIIYIAESIYYIKGFNPKPIVFVSNKELRDNGFNPNIVNQVSNGTKRTHKGYKFKNYFKLSREEKEKYFDIVAKSIKI